eukprot:3366995-Rhodomonas_salina.1
MNDVSQGTETCACCALSQAPQTDMCGGAAAFRHSRRLVLSSCPPSESLPCPSQIEGLAACRASQRYGFAALDAEDRSVQAQGFAGRVHRKHRQEMRLKERRVPLVWDGTDVAKVS